MNYEQIIIEDLAVIVEQSHCGSTTHVMLHVEPQDGDFSDQWQRMQQAEKVAMSMLETKAQGTDGKPRVALKRYFLSDATNQVPVMGDLGGASAIQQPPLDGSKIATWMWIVADNAESAEVCKPLWTNGMISTEGDSAAQTTAVLKAYEAELAQHGATIEDHCLRTWFFVRDVDTQYNGMVRARKEFFIEHGLTEQTHYIASTGIGGNPADPKALIQFGAFAVPGIKKEQVRYLYGSTHLNPTSEYGVTFERGVEIDLPNEKLVFISGTASINNKGEVLHVGDIIKQTERMWENVEVLLKEADCTYGDVAQAIVYLRDMADYSTVKRMFENRFPNIPMVFTLAPVCRPTWLIEMECIAIR